MDPLRKLIHEDSLLPSHIKSFGEIPKASDCKVILLTGVTGNLGPHLLKNLLKRPDLKIYCLVRKTAVELGQKILGDMKIENDVEKRVVLIIGDLSQEKLGIESPQYEDLCLEVDAVIHSAVKSHHLEMYNQNIDKPNDIRTVNVMGTLKVLEFVTTGKVKRIFYASSIFGCNRISDTETTLSEELIEDDNNGDGLVMGYAVTKFIGDKLMSQAIRRGIPAFVCRFPLMILDSETGYMDFKNNHFYCIMLSFVETGIRPIYPSTSPVIPVDICAKISIEMFFRDDIPEGIYNLMNPHDFDPKFLKKNGEEFFDIQSVKYVSFKEFSTALISQGEKSSLYPFRLIYFDPYAEEILAQLNLTTKCLLSEEMGKYLENISSKFRKYVPNINELIEPPHDLLLQIYKLGDKAGYGPKTKISQSSNFLTIKL